MGVQRARLPELGRRRDCATEMSIWDISGPVTGGTRSRDARARQRTADNAKDR